MERAETDKTGGGILIIVKPLGPPTHPPPVADFASLNRYGAGATLIYKWFYWITLAVTISPTGNFKSAVFTGITLEKSLSIFQEL